MAVYLYLNWNLERQCICIWFGWVVFDSKTCIWTQPTIVGPVYFCCNVLLPSSCRVLSLWKMNHTSVLEGRSCVCGPKMETCYIWEVAPLKKVGQRLRANTFVTHSLEANCLCAVLHIVIIVCGLNSYSHVWSQLLILCVVPTVIIMSCVVPLAVLSNGPSYFSHLSSQLLFSCLVLVILLCGPSSYSPVWFQLFHCVVPVVIPLCDPSCYSPVLFTSLYWYPDKIPQSKIPQSKIPQTKSHRPKSHRT